jgi:hypothetical protein
MPVEGVDLSLLRRLDLRLSPLGAEQMKMFEAIADKQIGQGGFGAAREISRDGTRELPWGAESITGYNLIEAESLDEAEEIAKDCPYIASIRVYEIRSA